MGIQPRTMRAATLESVRLFDFLHKYLALGQSEVVEIGPLRRTTRKNFTCADICRTRKTVHFTPKFCNFLFYFLCQKLLFSVEQQQQQQKNKKSTSSTKHTRHYNDTPYIKLRRALYNNIYWTVLWMLREKQHEISAKTLNIEKEKSERKKAILNSFSIARDSVHS